MRRTAWLFLGLLVAAPSFAQDADFDQDANLAPEDAIDVSIRGGCGGATCYVGEDVPKICRDQGCNRCAPTDSDHRKGVCVR